MISRNLQISGLLIGALSVSSGCGAGETEADVDSAEGVGEEGNTLDAAIHGLIVSRRISHLSPLAAGCGADLSQVNGANQRNAEVQPMVASDPIDPLHLIALYQQDRWTGLGSKAVLTAVSFDLGMHWQPADSPAFTPCSGGTAASGGDLEVATDSWVAISPTGTAFQVAFGLNRTTADTAILVSRSTDGGLAWGDPVTLQRDREARFFNDRPTVTADPYRPGTAYIVWDRLDDTSTATAWHWYQPVWMSMTTDDGKTWSPAREIHNPGLNSGVIGTQLVVLPDRTLLMGYEYIVDDAAAMTTSYYVAVTRSTDGGRTWSAPIVVDDLHQEVFGTLADPDGGSGAVRKASMPLMAVDRRSGLVHMVWPDNRFSGPRGLDVVYSQSKDGGLTWTNPVKINKTSAGAPATDHAIAVRDDGMVGVTHYDFRNNTPDPATLPTDFWLVSCNSNCTLASQWRERHVAGPWDARRTAVTRRGIMLGDYTGLTTFGGLFVSVFGKGTGEVDNPTDIQSALILPN
jgi:hypothetical protein